MKKLLIILAILAIPVMVQAAHITSDPLPAGITSVAIDGLPGGVVKAPLMPDRTIYYDIAGLPAGDYTIKGAGCVGEGVWEACGAYGDPLSFTKPTISLPSTGVPLKLSK